MKFTSGRGGVPQLAPHAPPRIHIAPAQNNSFTAAGVVTPDVYHSLPSWNQSPKSSMVYLSPPTYRMLAYLRVFVSSSELSNTHISPLIRFFFFFLINSRVYIFLRYVYASFLWDPLLPVRRIGIGREIYASPRCDRYGGTPLLSRSEIT